MWAMMQKLADVLLSTGSRARFDSRELVILHEDGGSEALQEQLSVQSEE